MKNETRTFCCWRLDQQSCLISVKSPQICTEPGIYQIGSRGFVAMTGSSYMAHIGLRISEIPPRSGLSLRPPLCQGLGSLLPGSWQDPQTWYWHRWEKDHTGSEIPISQITFILTVQRLQPQLVSRECSSNSGTGFTYKGKNISWQT